jgi:hypothetical protein
MGLSPWETVPIRLLFIRALILPAGAGSLDAACSNVGHERGLSAFRWRAPYDAYLPLRYHNGTMRSAQVPA